MSREFPQLGFLGPNQCLANIVIQGYMVHYDAEKLFVISSFGLMTKRKVRFNLLKLRQVAYFIFFLLLIELKSCNGLMFGIWLPYYFVLIVSLDIFKGSNISGKDGRIHCSLNINTETGRLSARRPNLQVLSSCRSWFSETFPSV